MTSPDATTMSDELAGVPVGLALAAVLGMVALVYLPTLGFDFVYDDGWTLVANGFLRHPEDLGLLWGPRAHTLGVPDAFRPVAVAFDMLTYQALGLSPALHHAVSIVLHTIACGLVFVWLRPHGAPAVVCLAATAAFGVLALHAEPVSVVSFREDLLAADLGLGALVLADTALRARPWRAGLAAVAAALAMLLACGAKASAVGLPVVWALLHATAPWSAPPRPRGRLLGVGILLVVAVTAAVTWRMLVLDGLSPYGADNPAVMEHRVGLGPVLAASTQIHLGYVWQLVVPSGLSPEYVDFAAAWTDPATLLAAAALAGLLVVGLASWHRRPRLAFAVLGTAVLAVPTSNFFGMPNMRADRLMYLPSLPACIGLAAGTWWIGARLATRTGRAAWRWIPLLAWIVVQGAAARGASATYRSDRRLWEIGLRRAPDSARAHAVIGELLGLRYVDTGSGDAAILGRARAHCRLAVAYDPLDPLSWLCHGRLDVIERAPERAFRNFERALGLAHQRREAIGATLAEVTLERRDLPFETRAVSAVAQIEQWRAWAPYSATVAQVAGDLHHRLGHADRALAAYTRASSLRPERWDLVARRVELQLDLGHPWAAAAALAARTSYDDVDPARRSQLVRRLAAAQRLWPTD